MGIFLFSTLAGQPAVTDVYHSLPMGASQLSGELDAAVRFVQEYELKNIDWAMYVEQFRSKTEWGNSWYGEYWGKVMRGACLMYEYTQDTVLYNQLDAAVRDMLTTQDTVSGRISSFPSHLELQHWDIWCQKYVLLGFQYFYGICSDPVLKTQILIALTKQADYLLSNIGPGKQYSIVGLPNVKMIGITESSILEPMVKLYNMTGDQRYLDFATYIVNTGGTTVSQSDPSKSVFELARVGAVAPFQYPFVHSYALMSCFDGLIEYYHATGEEKWLPAINNIFNLLRGTDPTKGDVTIVGGLGCDRGEYLSNATINQTNLNMIDNDMQETCATVAWIKLSDEVLRLTGNPACVDVIEIAAYNVLLGNVNFNRHQGFFTFNNLTKMISAYRGYHIGSQLVCGFNTCCNAAGSTGISLLPKINMMTSATGFAMNLYMSGTVNAKAPSGNNVQFVTTTNYPYEGTVTITVNPTASENFDIDLRIPGWSDQVDVKVNGTSTSVAAVKGTYKTISRTWSAGDMITIDFDMRTQVVTAPDGKGLFEGLRRGPITMATDLRFGKGLHNKKIDRDANGYVTATVLPISTFTNRIEMEIPVTEGESFRVCDFASVGTTWDKSSLYAAWICKNDMQGGISPNKTYALVCKSTSRMAQANSAGMMFQGDFIEKVSDVSNNCYQFESISATRFRISQNGKYLMSMGTANGSKIILAEWTGENNQLWKLTEVSENEYNIVNSEGGSLISGSSTDDGIHIWDPANGSPLQIWRFVDCASINKK